MKKPPIVLMIEHSIKIFSSCLHIIIQIKVYILVKPSLLIFHSGSVATIIWSDDLQNLKIQVRMIDIVMKFKIFIQRLASEIVFILITLVLMRPVSTLFYIVLCLCSGLGLGNSGAAWQSYCC